MRERLSKLMQKVSGKRLAHRPGLPLAVVNHVPPKLVASRVSQKLDAKGAGPKSEPKSVGPKSIAKRVSPQPAGPPPTQGRTGWTVHRDVALRLKNLSIHEPDFPDDPGRELGAFKIRLAGSLQVRWDAGSLVQQRYAVKGYRTSTTPAMSNVCTFAAYDEGRLAGTVSLRLDSDEGLAADEVYHQELDMLRDAGRRLCEYTRLAVDVSRVSKVVLAGLFHTVYLYAKQLHNFDFVVIEVNPRHVAYYRNSLGFKAIGPERHNARVQAPAVLMGISFEEIDDQVHRHAGTAKQRPKTCSLYAYFFSPAEAAGILGRLKTLGAN